MAAQLLLRNVPSALALKFLLTDSFLAVIRFCHGFTLFGNVEVSLNPEMDFKEPSELRKISKERFYRSKLTSNENSCVRKMIQLIKFSNNTLGVIYQQLDIR
ncbi:hypothetical protein ACJJTC_003455 [Scirpophaga incertulas]